MQHGVHKLVVDSMNAFGSDQRIVHVGLTALHNLSIPSMFSSIRFIAGTNFGPARKKQGPYCRGWGIGTCYSTPFHAKPAYSI